LWFIGQSGVGQRLSRHDDRNALGGIGDRL
jgi:hypothetical protein